MTDSNSKSSKTGVDRLEKSVLKLVRKWCPRLNIAGDWTVKVSFDEQTDTANCTVDHSYKNMHIRFNPDKILQELPEGPEKDFYLEELVVHELCHIYTYRVWQLTERLVAHYMPGQDHKLWADLLIEMHEEATTSLGMAFTQLGRSLEGK